MARLDKAPADRHLIHSAVVSGVGRGHTHSLSAWAHSMSDEDRWRLPPTQYGRDIRLGRDRAPQPLPSGAKAWPGDVVAKTPEVMVKLTGRARGAAGHLLAQLDYITRTGSLTAETHDGERITGRAQLLALHDDWLLANAADGRGRDAANAAQSVALTLSMPPGTPPDRVEAAARRWAEDTFAGTHDWVMVRHNDTGHPHVHIAVRAVGTDGRRLAPGPADLQHWRERFALELRRLGVEAEATPRVARGPKRHAPAPAAGRTDQCGATPPAAAAIRQAAGTAANASRPSLADGSHGRAARHSSARRADLNHADILHPGGRPSIGMVLRNTQDTERRCDSPAPGDDADGPGLHHARPPAGPAPPEPTRFRPRGRG